MPRQKLANNKAQGNTQSPTLNSKDIQILTSVLKSRAMLASRLGMQYDGKRDIFEALGYPKRELEFSDYFAKYLRQDIAKAVIDKPVKKTWSGPLTITEPTEREDKTPLQRDWETLNKKLQLKTQLSRLDRLVGLGKYAVLLLGFDDVNGTWDMSQPVKAGKLKLLYVRPFSEATARIAEWEDNPGDPRYGLPRRYNIDVKAPGGAGNNQSLVVHHSRVLHVVEDSMSSEVEGIPRLQAIYNRLMDLEKLVGGDAEMFWRGARPGYAGKLDKEYNIDPATKDDMMEQVEEFEHDMRRILINEGVELKALQQQIADPSGHVEVQVQLISAEAEIPKRILMGSERGELASSQDQVQWFSLIKSRREEYAEPRVVRPLVDKLIQLGVLSAPQSQEEGYTVDWEDLFAPSKKEKAEVGKARTEALTKYADKPAASSFVPPRAFYKMFLGLDGAEVDEIETALEEAMQEEGSFETENEDE